MRETLVHFTTSSLSSFHAAAATLAQIRVSCFQLNLKRPSQDNYLLKLASSSWQTRAFSPQTTSYPSYLSTLWWTFNAKDCANERAFWVVEREQRTFASRSHVKCKFANTEKLEKIWQEWRHVLFVANSLSICSSTVVVSFTHASFSLSIFATAQKGK